MKLAYALAHPPDANAGSFRPNLGNPFLRHSLALILNLHINLVRLASKTYLCGLTSRMTMNVCQTFLHETKYGEFHFRVQPL
jgi:hypothetical protein